MDNPVYLKYIGNGHALHGVPARDMTKDEVDKYVLQLLLDSGLYQLADAPKPEPKSKAKTLKPDVGVDVQEGD